jgi:hypothetical protein
MGTVELNILQRELLIESHIYLYGNAVTETIRKDIQEEIETMWNEPRGIVIMNGFIYRLIFKIDTLIDTTLDFNQIVTNDDPRKNFFRVEEMVHGNISFVDGINSNTGYLKVENLYKGSTTAAHEYGHTLGLDHPANMDIRGKGRPGIMYPRGTLVDPEFQYDPNIPAGEKGGTMHPMYRKVYQSDIDDLQLTKSKFQNNIAVIGAFSGVHHEAHPSNESKGWMV